MKSPTDHEDFLILPASIGPEFGLWNAVLDTSTPGMSHQADKLAIPDGIPYTVWKLGCDRFAITPGREAAPVLGYAVKRPDADGWSIERKGQVFPSIYGSLTEAAKALYLIAVGQSQGEPLLTPRFVSNVFKKV